MWIAHETNDNLESASLFSDINLRLDFEDEADSKILADAQAKTLQDVSEWHMDGKTTDELLEGTDRLLKKEPIKVQRASSAKPSVVQTLPLMPPTRKIGRNEPCCCGSGKKHKHCHGKNE